MKNSITSNILSQIQIIAGEIEDFKKKIGGESNVLLSSKIKFAEIIQLLKIDGYPNVSKKFFEEIPAKDLNWFLKRVDSDVFLTNIAGESGMITIEDDELAALLFQEAPANGFKVISKIERDKSVLGRGYYYPELLSQKPKRLSVYEYRFYLNGELKEKCFLLFKDYTEDKHCYKFSKIIDIQDAYQNLEEINEVAEWFVQNTRTYFLTTEEGCFPMHLKKIGTDLLSFESFDFNEKATQSYHEKNQDKYTPKKFKTK